ncbi:hypothetical protein [Ralstonia insidiosa]|jgi:hypothetical protein|nr:hypothetical protein [Ralstonia insidiosa]MBA9939857.1 hypothetical protein [Ralstonia insidiosa]MBC9968522.1 hypothetical protein [Ralstonia insidiosa]MBX3904657.1 hypothetical protein [Ralstonia insidiosa]
MTNQVQAVDAGTPARKQAQRSLDELYALWDELRDIPVTEDGQHLDAVFQHFSKGAEIETVWRWFEAQNPQFIVGDVQRGVRRADPEWKISERDLATILAGIGQGYVATQCGGNLALGLPNGRGGISLADFRKEQGTDKIQQLKTAGVEARLSPTGAPGKYAVVFAASTRKKAEYSLTERDIFFEQQKKEFVGKDAGFGALTSEDAGHLCSWRPASGHPNGWRLVRGVATMDELRKSNGSLRLFKSYEAAKTTGDVLNSQIKEAVSHLEQANGKVPQTLPTLWERDEVQFARLLVEIVATQDKLDMEALAASMDLSVDQVSSLLGRAEAAWETIKAKSLPEHAAESSVSELSEVRKTVLQYTVLHDDEIDLSTMSLEEIGQACREGGYIGGALSVVSDEQLTRAQLDVAAAKLGADPTFFCIDDDDDALAQPSSGM